MRVALLDVQSRPTAINKTMAGGFGTSSDYGSSRSPLLRLLKSVKRNGVRIPLIELAYLAAILRRNGHEVLVSHSVTPPPADLYLVYLSLVEFDQEMAAVRAIRRLNPDARVGLIGTLATVRPGDVAAEADFVIRGESETLVRHRIGELRSLRGVLQSPLQNNLELLPYPDWSVFDMRQSVHRPFFGGDPVYPVLSSRGCPFSCRYYCAYPLVAGGRVRFRPVAAVLAELHHLHERYGARAVLFRDANFTLDMDRTAELCRRLMEMRLPIRWACETHLSRLSRPLLDLMRAAGVRAITVGVETRTGEVLRSSHRPDCGDRHLREIIRHCEQAGIMIMAGYILGGPGDTPASIRRTIEFARRLNTSYAQFTLCTPYPGTRFFADVQSSLLTRDWQRFDSYTPVFAHPGVTPSQLISLKEEAYRTYYFRPRWILGRLLPSAVRELAHRADRLRQRLLARMAAPTPRSQLWSSPRPPLPSAHP